MLTDRAKSILLDYDSLASIVGETCLLCLSPTSVMIALQFAEYARWSTRYVSPTSAEIDQTQIEDWADLLEFELMSCVDDLQKPMFRFTDEGVLQISTDGGLTWQDAPGYDPRLTAPRLPSLTGENIACRTSDAIEQFAKDFRLKVYDVLNIGAIAIAIIGTIVEALSLAFGLEIFTPLIMEFVGEIVALSGADFLAAITDGYMDTFRCIIYCQLLTHEEGLQGTFTQDDVAVIGVQIVNGFDNIIPRLFFELFLLVGGVVGLSNTAHYAAFPGDDCGDCECCTPTSYEYNWAGNVVTEYAPFEALTTTDIPVNTVPSWEGYGSGDYIFEFGVFSGGHYFNAGEVQSLGATGLKWSVPEDLSTLCRLKNISVGNVSGAGYAQAYLFIKRDGNWNFVGSPELWYVDVAFEIHDVAQDEGNVTDIAIILNSSYTPTLSTYLGYVKFDFA